MSESGDSAEEGLRIDKWLWRARFFKTRALAAKLAASGKLRVNSVRTARASRAVRPGDVLTFAQGERIRVVRVEALGERRGPAAEAAALYTDLDPAPPPDQFSSTTPPTP